MKRYFIKTNGFNMVVFVDPIGNGYIIPDTSFDCELTFENAKNADYSNLDGCETAEECFYSMGFGEKDDLIIDFYENDPSFETVIEF